MIVTEAVSAYLDAVRPAPDPVLAEMEEHGRRDRIPIVGPDTARLLTVLTVATGARRVVEVGTAIGVSTLAIARGLPADGVVVTFEVDEERQAAARDYLRRADVLDRVDLRLEPGLEGLARLDGTFDLAFIDAVKLEYGGYLEAIVPLMRPGGLIAVDNVLMSGTVAEGKGAGNWSDEQVVTARAFNERLLSHAELEGTITPVGDGVALAVRR